MLDVLFIYPPVFFDKTGLPRSLDVEHPPLGILYLAAVLRNKGYKVGVIDIGAQEINLSRLIKEVKKYRPKILGISSMTATLRGAVQAAETVKKEFPKILVAIGGPHVSADPGIVTRMSNCFDIGVTGEAEITFPEILAAVKNRKRIKKLYISKPVLDIDNIPEPARDLITGLPYKKGAMLFSSRGCPYNCIFCSRPAIDRRIRYRSPKFIVDEMEKLYRNGENFFMFEDDTLTLNREHALGLFAEIISRGLKVRWTGITRADHIDEELIKMAKESGCVEITFGVESGSERIRNKIIHKNLPDSVIKNAFRLCNRYGIKVNAFLMLGFPTETRKDIEKTTNFYKNYDLNIIGLHITIPLPGSEVFRIALEEKKIDLSVIDRYAKGELGEGFHGVWPYYVPKGLTFKDLETYRKQAYRKFYFRPEYVLKRFKEDLRSWERLKFDVVTALNLFRKGDTSRQ